MNITRKETVIVTIELTEREARALKTMLEYAEGNHDIRKGLVTIRGVSGIEADNIARMVMELKEELSNRV